MSISGINPLNLNGNLFPVGGTQAISPTAGLAQTPNALQGTDTDADNSSVGKADSTQISKAAQLYSKLQQLQQTDPTKFKQIVTDIANKLQEAAKNATGNDPSFLSSLADKFQQAGQGNLAALQPPPPSGNSLQAAYKQNQSAPVQPLSGKAPTSGRHPHHHHHDARSSATQQTLSSIFNELSSALSGASSTAATATVTTTPPSAPLTTAVA